MSESQPLPGNEPTAADIDAPASGRPTPEAGTDPGTAHTDPGTAQADPGTAQADPGTAHTDPGTAHTDPGTAHTDPGTDPAVEIVDGLPVLAEVRTIERGSPSPLPAVQVAAVAATGFVAGAATVVLVKRRSARRLGRTTRGGPRRAVDMLPIAASRSFLVDVHVISRPD